VRFWSKDPGTKVGCVLVQDRRIVSTGYNGFPIGISDDFRRYGDRDYKLNTTVHAETNAIINSAKNGTRVEGSTLYVTFPPCSHCASAIIQAGVTKIICPNPKSSPERWRQNFLSAGELFFEAGVKVLYYSDSDLWTVDNAPFVGQNGFAENSTGARESRVKTKTLTLLFVDLLRRIKRKIVSILSRGRRVE